MTTLGKIVKKRLIEQGISHKELARRIGTSPGYLHHILAGRKPLGKYAAVLARELGLSLEELHRLSA